MMEVSPDLTDQLVFNISNDAIGTIAQHSRADAKSSRKRKSVQSDAAKIESIYKHIDILKTTASLVESTLSYLEAVLNDETKCVLLPAISCLEYMSSVNKQQLAGVALDANNTKAKKQASVSHAKLNKVAKMKASDHDIKVKTQMKSHPKQIIRTLLKEAKLAVQAIESNSTPGFTAHDDTDIAMLPRKQTRLNEEENRDTEVHSTTTTRKWRTNVYSTRSRWYPA